MKNFVKVMDPFGSGIQYIKTKFPMITEARRNGGIYVGLQIRYLIKDPDCERNLNKCVAVTW